MLAALLLAIACNQSDRPTRKVFHLGEWYAFEGTWTAGTRRTLRLGANDRAAIFELTGSVLLTGARRPAVGFRAQAIGFSTATLGCKDAASGPTNAVTWFTAS
jgi:hypothetical protein